MTVTETQTRERPILFSGEMVRQILAGRKSQTRRFINPQPTFAISAATGEVSVDDDYLEQHCPYGLPGDRLWVRENFTIRGLMYGRPMADVEKFANKETCIAYRADDDPARKAWKWRPSIHMPRWACRIELEVTAVKVERLRDIDELDALAEGVMGERIIHGTMKTSDGKSVTQDWIDGSCRDGYAALWDRINGKDPDKRWAANPYVWCVSFKVVKP